MEPARVKYFQLQNYTYGRKYFENVFVGRTSYENIYELYYIYFRFSTRSYKRV